MNLFDDDQLVGVFRGFSEGGLEFRADLMLAYQSEFQTIPMHGQFLVVQLESEDEAVLGRITELHAEGRLASASGDDFALRALSERRSIPENLRDQYLKYRVGIRVLGVIHAQGDREPVFVPSQRRLPHVGSPVAFLSPGLLQWVAGHTQPGAELGYLALGEFVYCGDDDRIERKQWMRARHPQVITKFDVSKLVSRRSFVFARAGFGKSNLIKLLFSDLYRTTPVTTKARGREVPVGTLIFDPDGEYFWPDDNDRPGLCDVPDLKDQVVVFTDRVGPSAFYGSFIAGPIKLDIRQLPASSVVAIALDSDRQADQNVIKLRRLDPGRWQRLVNLIQHDGMLADDQDIGEIMHMTPGRNDAEITAIKSNMSNIVAMLHDPASQMLDMLLEALRNGKLCVVDISRMRGHRGRVLGGLIMQHIFDNNQHEWTRAEPHTIPVIAVIEEAQSVLGPGSRSSEDPYVVWTKEGRKYDLGALLVTQQPGSIDAELLSQGDNWFMFHLLSAGDLQSVKRANSHFSDDILSSLLNEPIPGNGVFWSSAFERQYPIPFRPLAFERVYRPIDPARSLDGVTTYASRLKETFSAQLREKPLVAAAEPQRGALDGDEPDSVQTTPDQVPVDALATYTANAIRIVRADRALLDRLNGTGLSWYALFAALLTHLPTTMTRREDVAKQLTWRFMDEVAGPGRYRKEKRPKADGSGETTYLVIELEPPASASTKEQEIPF